MLLKTFLVFASVLLLSAQVQCQEVDPDATGPIDVPNTETPEVAAGEPDIITDPPVEVMETVSTTPPPVEEQSTVDAIPMLEPVAPEANPVPVAPVDNTAEEVVEAETTPVPAEEITPVADVTEETVTEVTIAAQTTLGVVLVDDLGFGDAETSTTSAPETSTGILIVATPVAGEAPDATSLTISEDVTGSSTSTTTKGTSTTIAGFVPVIGVLPVGSIRAKTDLVDEPGTPADVEDVIVEETTITLPIVVPGVFVADTTTKKAIPVVLVGTAGSGTEAEAAGKVWVPGPAWSSTPSPVIPITDSSSGFASRWEGFRWWVHQWGLLLFGLLLLLLIILVMIYACCCMKKAAVPVGEKRFDVERIERLRPVDLLRKSDKSYQEELSSGTTIVQSYRETTQTIRETGPHGAPLGAGTPNNSFAVMPNTRSGIENQNFRGTPNNTPGYKFITPRHLDSGVIAHSPTPPPTYADRRLDVPPNRLSSRDVISASRAPTAVSSEAPSVPLHAGTLERDASLERERPVLRGGNPDRSSSPRPYSVHRTTLLITPSVNRDPDQPFNPAEQNPGLTYSDYVGMIRGEPSDFGQYSPDRRPLPAYNSSGRLLRDANTESQV